MEINTLTHYQTSFRVKSKDERDVYTAVQNVIFGWLCEKLKNQEGGYDLAQRDDRKAFFTRCTWEDFQFTSIATNFYKCEEYTAWALRLTERKYDQGSFWYTDIAIKVIGDMAVFYCRVAYAWNLHDLRAHDSAPSTNVPRFVRYLTGGNFKVYSGTERYDLFNLPVPFSKVEHGKYLAGLIMSPARKYPVLIFNGQNALEDEAKFFAKRLAGKCQVILIKDDEALAEEIRKYLPKEMRVPYGGFRVFFALDPENPRPERHRYYYLDEATYHQDREAIINNLLRNHPLEEEGCVRNISDVSRMLTLYKLLRFRDEHSELSKEVDEITKLITDIEKERDEANEEASYMASEHSIIQEEKRALESKLGALSIKGNSDALVKERAEWAAGLSAFPETLLQVSKTFQSLHSDRLIFLDWALKSAEEYVEFSDIEHAWKMFYHLATTMHAIKFQEGGKGDFERIFRERTGIELATSEGTMTNKNKDLVKLRKVNYGEREYDISFHLKHQNAKPRLLRIHFAFVDTEQKILVGYVGPHMPNHTTLTKKF
ncbi:hypothetical protein [Cerasicoccus arenae]|uniref:Uncharacterized protein n=1 Tax=Cerasicoccus arenae TaxID=424488 RepID=A0A8J3DML6_9BACT|nr:hypothetical protein [Cerasicoccus arenae]MBK1857778.1 hypothetical protein [Cerasicoccus arenae]GHC12004.1 hypothetical protein GCM10007047_31740 [Cerasicoccus arenae]